jgi:hypothetical protein
MLLDIVSRLVFVRHGRDMYTPDGAKDPNTSAHWDSIQVLEFRLRSTREQRVEEELLTRK